jgi:putative nucleotidyltransferase with HDIG domain
VDDLVRDLQGAITARHLYPSGHPHLEELLDRLERGARSLTAERPELSIFALDGRVASEGAVLARGESLAREFFTTLRSNGYHRLTVHRGVSRQEFESFVAQMARSARPGMPGAGLHSTEHLRLTALEPVSADKSFAVLDVMVRGGLPIRDLWSGINERRALDVDAVENMGLALLRMLETQADSMIPLSDLRTHDDYTVIHVANVSMLAIALAEVVGVRADVIRTIGIAALLHDIGKLNVPASILNAATRLTDKQLAVIRRHPEEGARILFETPGVPELAVLVAYEHHVQFDGGGYPTIPRGWKISLASSITQVADVYDALRSNRPYRAGLSGDRIEEMMRRDAGTVFHPELVKAFFDQVVPRTSEQE